jgi:cytochrome b6-f complex iron-sulfur subunit
MASTSLPLIATNAIRSNADMPNLTRRDFLKMTTDLMLALASLLGLGGLFRFLDFQPNPDPPTEFDLGAASQYAMGSRTVLPNVPAVLLHEKSGFSALSLVCTHLGCTVEMQSTGFACPCHGSRFGPEGKVERGPAAKPLPNLRVEETSDGILHLYTI